MDLSYGAEAEAFRSDVRHFVKDYWLPGERRGAELKDYVRSFRRAGIDAGYLYRSVPKRFGGSEQPGDVIRARVTVLARRVAGPDRSLLELAVEVLCRDAVVQRGQTRMMVRRQPAA